MKLALTLLFAFATALLHAQPDIEVRSPSAKLLDVSPGHVVTASVVVMNRGSQEDEIVERFDLPSGCQKVAPPDLPFRLAPGAQTIRVIAVHVPPNMAAGRFDIRYTAQSKRDPSSIGSIDLAIQVANTEGLDLVVDPPQGPSLAGDSFTVNLRATNRGNSRLSARLASRSSLGFAMKVSPLVFDLAPGTTQEITCVVETDRTCTRHTNHAATFDLTATTAAGKTLTASQASVVEIIPLISGVRDPFHKLPIKLRFTGIAESSAEGKQAAHLQTELSGEGSLDEAGKHRVNFLLRGPDVQTSTLFGERDEYGASYRGEHWDIDIGDRIYSLSPLTEKHTLGRGLGVAWHNEKIHTGMFYMTTRFRQQDTEEFAAYYRQKFTDTFSLQANVLRKTGPDSLSPTAMPQNIVTLESRNSFAKWLDLRLEAGLSRADNGRSDSAWRVEARGTLPGKVNYSLEHAHAGPDFRGYITNTDNTYFSFNKEFGSRFRLNGSLNRYAGNFATNDVLSSVVNQEDFWQIGVTWQMRKETELSLGWQHVQREDVLLPAAYDFTEDAARIGVSQTFGKLQAQAYVDLGTLDNSVTGESGAFTRYSTVLNWRPTDRQTYSAFANYGPSSYTGSTDTNLAFGASARWQLTSKLAANISYSRNQYDNLTGHEQDQALASVQYRFENKSTLSLVARWLHGRDAKLAGTDSTDEAAVLMTFTMPFDLAVSRKRSIGILEGRVVNVTGGHDDGIPRVVVQVDGQFAATNSAGRFEFPALKPGTHEIKIVPDSLGPRLAMITPLPKVITIRPAETTHVTLEATAACSVNVCVKNYEFPGGATVGQSGEPKEAVGELAAFVEITNGRDTWRAQTDRLGCATFDRLPEGRWTLRVATSNPSPLRLIENPERTLDLKAGEARNVPVRILPQRRTLKMLDKGTIR